MHLTIGLIPPAPFYHGEGSEYQHVMGFSSPYVPDLIRDLEEIKREDLMR
jgi:hypothetical protein